MVGVSVAVTLTPPFCVVTWLAPLIEAVTVLCTVLPEPAPAPAPARPLPGATETATPKVAAWMMASERASSVTPLADVTVLLSMMVCVVSSISLIATDTPAARAAPPPLVTPTPTPPASALIWALSAACSFTPVPALSLVLKALTFLTCASLPLRMRLMDTAPPRAKDTPLPAATEPAMVMLLMVPVYEASSSTLPTEMLPAESSMAATSWLVPLEAG